MNFGRHLWVYRAGSSDRYFVLNVRAYVLCENASFTLQVAKDPHDICVRGLRMAKPRWADAYFRFLLHPNKPSVYEVPKPLHPHKPSIFHKANANEATEPCSSFHATSPVFLVPGRPLCLRAHELLGKLQTVSAWVFLLSHEVG